MKLLTKINFNKKTEEADKFCKFDFDPVPEVIEEHLKLSGWVVGIESPAVGIELIQDGQLVREVPLTIDRPLPNQIYATFPGAEQSGFIIDTTLEKINLESVHILIQAVLENFQRIPLASLNIYKDEETIQDLAQTKAELDETREELERLQSQFDEVLAELEQAHLQLYQTEQDQSEKGILINLEEQQQLEDQEEQKNDKVLLCAIAKNEAAYLVEWIAYHKFIVGFDEVLIYENDSRDNSRLILEKLDKLGICQYKHWPRSKGVVPQRSAYNDALQTYSQSYQWVCFLDLDEFLVLKSFNTIQDCIKSFEGKADSIVINWLMFGSLGHSNYTPEPVTQRFTKCADYSSPIHKHMKSISKIDSIEVLDIHIPQLKPNSRYFHIDGTELHFGANPTLEHIKGKGHINHQPAQINHYQSKSLEEYKCRKLKGRATVDERSPESHLKPGDFDRTNSYCNQIENLDILATISTLNHKIDFIYQALGIKETYQDKFKEFIQLEAARYDNLVRSSAPNQMEQPKSKTAISTNVEQKMIKENDSEKPNKVFGIGLSKTATASLTQAMRILGYKSKHYLLNPDVDIIEHEFLIDMPIQTRYQEYDKKYPGSKFILTVRDKESWLRSCMNHFRSPVRNKNSLSYKYRIEQTGINGYNEDIFSRTYDQHIENIKEYFKQREGDLLILDICGGEGWDKLCAFLGKEIPKQPFPKIHVSKNKSSIVAQTVIKQETDHLKTKAQYDSLAQSPTLINKLTMPKISSVPLWAPEAVGKISEFLMGRSKAKILEFGSGGSTIWLSSYDVDLISIEHDQSWFSALQSKLEDQKISNVRLLYREKPYFKIADEFPDHHFDLILVDGRDRNKCIQASLKKVKNGGLLVLDDAQRTRYRTGRNLLEAFPSVRYHHPHRYTQIWFIRHDLNCRALAVDNPFGNPSKTVSSKAQTQEQLPKLKQAVSTGNPRENERFLYYKTLLTNLVDIPNKKGLEIGAFDRPFITPREGLIDYSDYRNTEELKQLAKSAVGHDPKFVVDVTYDLKQISLSDIPQKYDYIIASHVLEHTPNMIGFLNNIAHLLADNGFAFLMIPDKRYTFDCLKPVTTLGELLENHFNSLDKPSFRQVFNGYYYNRPINASDVWSGKIQDSQSLARVPRDLKEIISKALQSKESYIDSHCNIFTDVHFEDVISELIQGGLLNFSKAEVHKIQPGFLDFLCILHK